MNQSVAASLDKENSPDKDNDESATPNSTFSSEVRIRIWIVAAFILLFLATLFIVAPHIQQRLDRLTQNRLAQAGVSTELLHFDWDYRNLTVSGYLPEGVTKQRLAAIMRGSSEPESALFANGIRHLSFDLEDGLPFAGVVDSETIAIHVTGNSEAITIAGVVQNSAQRNLLVQAALASGVDNVFDNLEVQSIPDTAAVKNGINALAAIVQQLGPLQVRRSELSLHQNELHYRVTARDKDGALAIERAASSVAGDLTITGGVELLNGNNLNLIMVADGQHITLKGKTFSENQKKRLLFAAGEAVGVQNVVDNLTIAEVQSDALDLTEKVESFAAVISRFAPGITGDVTLRNGELNINAETGSEAVRDYLASSTARAQRTGLSVSQNIRIPKPKSDAKALQASLDNLTAEVRQTVVFASGEAVLSPQAMQTLDKVASAIGNYSGLVIEIEGHTDDVGRAGVNEKLSQSRASSVRDYLAAAVAPVNQLIAVGYGHRRPLESNDTPEGRQANRRVHFTVLKQSDEKAG